ncbi:hypothetical protein [Xanthobacter wiegelii]|uniref:hypothetical protein n=1 Tax=Xanthobacter wiegelii TaxID=3119913 RepID=UPI003726FF59
MTDFASWPTLHEEFPQAAPQQMEKYEIARADWEKAGKPALYDLQTVYGWPARGVGVGKPKKRVIEVQNNSPASLQMAAALVGLLEALKRRLDEGYRAAGRIDDKFADLAELPSSALDNSTRLNVDLKSISIYRSPDQRRTIYDIRLNSIDEIGLKPAPQKNTANEKPNRGGRPPVYRWDDIIDCLMLIIVDRGLPETQGQLVEFVQQAARNSGHKTEPDESTIRGQFKRFPKFSIASKALR